MNIYVYDICMIGGVPPLQRGQAKRGACRHGPT
jgi:hypothetical protein